MPESIQVLLDTEEITVVGPPDIVTVAFDTGATGKRGSMWFSGAGMPGPSNIDYNDLRENDMYMDTNDGAMYQYILTPSNVLDWTKVGQAGVGPAGPAVQDTGWRQVSSWVVNPNASYASIAPTQGALYVRRFGNMVIMTTRGAGLTSSQPLAITVGTGFYDDSAVFQVTPWDSTAVRTLGPTSGTPAKTLYHMGSGPFAIPASTKVFFTATWVTNEAWPTTLPGTAA